MVEKLTMTCQGCGSTVTAHTQVSSPDNGWSMDIDSFGYYGGFTDTWIDPDEDPRWFNICHACVLRVIEAVPGLRNFLKPGGHPCDNDKPCCEYAWKADMIDGKTVTYIANHRLEWVLHSVE